MKLSIDEIIKIKELIEREENRILKEYESCKTYIINHPDENDVWYNWDSEYHKEDRENLQAYKNILYKINKIEI